MMNYDTFATAVVARIKDILPQSFALHEVERRTVYKPNKELDAMTLKCLIKVHYVLRKT